MEYSMVFVLFKKLITNNDNCLITIAAETCGTEIHIQIFDMFVVVFYANSATKKSFYYHYHSRKNHINYSTKMLIFMYTDKTFYFSSFFFFLLLQWWKGNHEIAIVNHKAPQQDTKTPPCVNSSNKLLLWSIRFPIDISN